MQAYTQITNMTIRTYYLTRDVRERDEGITYRPFMFLENYMREVTKVQLQHGGAYVVEFYVVVNNVNTLHHYTVEPNTPIVVVEIDR